MRILIWMRARFKKLNSIWALIKIMSKLMELTKVVEVMISYNRYSSKAIKNKVFQRIPNNCANAKLFKYRNIWNKMKRLRKKENISNKRDYKKTLDKIKELATWIYNKLMCIKEIRDKMPKRITKRAWAFILWMNNLQSSKC